LNPERGRTLKIARDTGAVRMIWEATVIAILEVAGLEVDLDA